MADSWVDFRDALAETLATLPELGVVIIRDRASPGRFVQFLMDSDHFRVEVSTAVDQMGRRPRTEQELSALRAAGWQDTGDPGLNYVRLLDWPAPSAGYRELADMMVIALRDVFEVPTPDRLGYEAWSNFGGEGDIDLPRLGLERVAG
ncbi:TY-Chap domain-containing protein [Actinoplanes sp. NPDC020271]|uniref:TY-Chap domain-containing protein n=1 Tax=Actinoplanes sp. NPDC020271 TaxID=3363896 RepID=UPI0037B090D4